MTLRLTSAALALLVAVGCARVPKAKWEERRTQKEASLAVIPEDLPAVREALAFVWEMTDAEFARRFDPDDSFGFRCVPDVANGHEFKFQCADGRVTRGPRLPNDKPARQEAGARRARLAKALLEVPWSGVLARDILTARTMYLLGHLEWDKEEWRNALDDRTSARFPAPPGENEREHPLLQDRIRWVSLTMHEGDSNDRVRKANAENIELTRQLSAPLDEVLRRFVPEGAFVPPAFIHEREWKKSLIAELQRELLRRVAIERPPPHRATWGAPALERLLADEPDADLREFWAVMLDLLKAQPGDAPDLSLPGAFAVLDRRARAFGAQVALARDPGLRRRLEALSPRLASRPPSSEPLEAAAYGYALDTTTHLLRAAAAESLAGPPPAVIDRKRELLMAAHLLRRSPALALAGLLDGRPLHELEQPLVPTARSLIAKLRAGRSGLAAGVLAWMDSAWDLDVTLTGTDADTKAVEACLSNAGLAASPQSTLSVSVRRGAPKVTRTKQTVTVRKTASDREAEIEALARMRDELEGQQQQADAQNRRTEQLLGRASTLADQGRLREKDEQKLEKIKGDYYRQKYADSRANRAAWTALTEKMGAISAGFDGEPTKQVTRTFETHAFPLKVSLAWAGEPPEEWTTWANYGSKPRPEEVATALGCAAAKELRRAWVARKLVKLTSLTKDVTQPPAGPVEASAAAFSARPDGATLAAFLDTL